VSIEEGVQKRVLLALLYMKLVICSHTHNYNRLCKESYKCLTERKRKKSNHTNEKFIASTNISPQPSNFRLSRYLIHRTE